MHCASTNEATDSFSVSKGELFTPTTLLCTLSNYKHLAVTGCKGYAADPSHWHRLYTVKFRKLSGLSSRFDKLEADRPDIVRVLNRNIDLLIDVGKAILRFELV